MPAPPTILPQQFGRYRIVGKIGEGGMGTVYRAVDADLQRDIALKVPQFGPDEDPSIIERFYREARLAGQIAHPNICPVYDVGEVNGIHYLTMPFIDGVPLSKLVSSERPWSVERAVDLIVQIAGAVHVMHQHGIIHRDLKPSNILLRFETEPVLMDFGLARPFRADGTALTATGAVMGTPAYMSPEQVGSAADELGPATDIYAVGVMLYELLTGKRPFYGPLAVVYAQILRVVPDPPSGLRSGLDPRLDAICLKALAKRPSERFASMEEMAAALNAVLGREAGPIIAPTTVAQLPEPRVTCPTCGKSLRVPDSLKGKRLKCPACKARLVTEQSLAPVERIAPDMAPTRPPSAGRTIGPARPRVDGSGSALIPLLSFAFLVGVIVVLLATSLTGKNVVHLQSVEAIHLRPGEIKKVHVRIARVHPPGSVDLTVENLPAGLECSPVFVPKGSSEATLELRAPRELSLASAWARVKATAGAARAHAPLVITVDLPAR